MAGERQVAIVTGAASGIGRAMSLGLLEGGIDVAAVDKEPAWLDELKAAASSRKFSGALHTIRADLTDHVSFDAIVSAVVGESGRIDILVNNAGIGQDSVRADRRRNPIRFWEITPEQWSRFVAVNATGPLMMARAVMPHMLGAKRGRIVTVTTSLGTMLREGYILYGASKAAAEAATAVSRPRRDRGHRQCAGAGRNDRYADHCRRRGRRPQPAVAARDHGAAAVVGWFPTPPLR
jgi:NAD(P)-dependent dehydrogenase (short-subunit alcohol dehydrogenase family)